MVLASGGSLLNGQSKLTAPDGEPFDRFGQAVAMTEDYLIVGAHRKDTAASNAGSVYIYSRTTSAHLRTLNASDAGANHLFGWSLAAIGNRVLIGAPGNDSGAAYLFDLDSGAQLAKLLPTAPASGDQFGHSVALSKSHALVGAWLEDDDDFNPSENSGAAYLFDAATFVTLHRLQAQNVEEADQFGGSVALTDDSACVGSLFDNHSGSSDAGSVTVFDITSGIQQRTIISDSPQEGDVFGVSIAAKNDLLVVGASEAEAQGDTSGAASLFQLSTGTKIANLLPKNGQAFDRIGVSVAIADKIIVGAFRTSVSGFADAGVAHTFTLTGDYENTLRASDAATGDFFGNAVAGLGAQALVGAVQDDDRGPSSGSAYLLSTEPPARLDNLTITVLGSDIALRWLATPDYQYAIYSTSNLAIWPDEPSAIVTPDTVDAVFIDEGATTMVQKFYRVVAESRGQVPEGASPSSSPANPAP